MMEAGKKEMVVRSHKSANMPLTTLASGTRSAHLNMESVPTTICAKPPQTYRQESNTRLREMPVLQWVLYSKCLNFKLCPRCFNNVLITIGQAGNDT